MRILHKIVFFPGQIATLFIIFIWHLLFPKQFMKLEKNEKALDSLAEKTYPFTITLSILFWIWLIIKLA